MSDETEINITQALLDPRWNIGCSNFVGVKVVTITLNHPVSGPIHSMIPIAVAIELQRLLAKAISDAGAERPNEGDKM